MFMQVLRAGIQIPSLWLGTIENGPASKLFRLLMTLVLPKKKIWSFVIRLFSFFLTSKCFVLFEVVGLLKLVSLFSTSLIFVFKTVAVVIPLVSGIFLSTSPIFCVYLCCIDLWELKKLLQEFCFLSYLLLSLVCWAFFNNLIIYYITYFFSSL